MTKSSSLPVSNPEASLLPDSMRFKNITQLKKKLKVGMSVRKVATASSIFKESITTTTTGNIVIAQTNCVAFKWDNSSSSEPSYFYFAKEEGDTYTFNNDNTFKVDLSSMDMSISYTFLPELPKGEVDTPRDPNTNETDREYAEYCYAEGFEIPIRSLSIDEVVNMYLSYRNGFLSISKFAEYYRLGSKQASNIINGINLALSTADLYNQSIKDTSNKKEEM